MGWRSRLWNVLLALLLVPAVLAIFALILAPEILLHPGQLVSDSGLAALLIAVVIADLLIMYKLEK